MLKNVRYSRSIGWVRLESNGEDIVRIISRDMEIVGTGLVMVESQGRQLQFWEMFCTLQREAVKNMARLWISLDVRHRGIASRC